MSRDQLGLVDLFLRSIIYLVGQTIAFTQTVMDDLLRHYPAPRGVILIGHYPGIDLSHEPIL